jgi:2-polyprenyl-3-methyl-5-hydroxy-6-metoxy-1,4-benzoquinol methylase
MVSLLAFAGLMFRSRRSREAEDDRMRSVIDDRGYNQGWAENRATNVRNERRCDYMISRMPSTQSGSILEIGCGTGKISFFLARKTGLRVLGTDICVPFIEEANERFQLPNLRYAVLDFNQASQFEGETFDCIVGNGILHHLYYHLDAALTNMHRLLKPGGRIVFCEPNLYNPYVFSIFRTPYLRKLANLEPDEMAFLEASRVEASDMPPAITILSSSTKTSCCRAFPDVFIAPSIASGAVLERIPLVRMESQSIFITATA